MADDIPIKLATGEDAGAVLQSLQATVTESDAVLVPHLDEISEETEAKNTDLINQFNDCVISLATFDEEVVGMVTVMVLGHQPTTGELGVVVRRKYWRNEISRLLIDEAEYWFDIYSSLENLTLTVFEGNTPAINFYQQLHFVTIGKTAEQGRDVLRMQYDNKKEETMEK